MATDWGSEVEAQRLVVTLELVDRELTIVDPEEWQISQALKSLVDREAAILTRKTGSEIEPYLQVLRLQHGQYQFEYNAGELPLTQYEAFPPPTEIEVISAFSKFARDDGSWFDEFHWRTQELPGPPEQGPPVPPMT